VFPGNYRLTPYKTFTSSSTCLCFEFLPYLLRVISHPTRVNKTLPWNNPQPKQITWKSCRTTSGDLQWWSNNHPKPLNTLTTTPGWTELQAFKFSFWKPQILKPGKTTYRFYSKPVNFHFTLLRPSDSRPLWPRTPLHIHYPYPKTQSTQPIQAFLLTQPFTPCSTRVHTPKFPKLPTI
jgi:hypothetical protein